MWLMNKLDVRYIDETDQTSCTAWNYHGSGIGNVVSLAAVFLRNFHQAYVSAKAQGLPVGTYYPLVHCGTSFGNYKEMRIFLMHSAELREQVKKILGKLGRLVDGKLLIPEEVVHYSEWLHMMRDRIKQHQVIDVSNIRATIHPACHVYKMVPEDVIYDDTVMDGNRVAVSTGLMQTLGAQVIDYSTWYDCCGFGFRHIIGEREFTRSFAIDRKIKVAVEEAKADVMVGHDTGCITTLDKNQWIGKAVDKVYALPILADCQFAALALGAHPYKLAQLHWHASPFEGLLEKLGIDWQKAKIEFEQYLDEVKAGRIETLYDPKRAITSGPGYVKPRPVAALPGAARMSRPVLIVGGGSVRVVGRACAGRGRPARRAGRTRPTGSAARRSCRAMPNWCRPASGPRTPSAAWSSALRADKLIDVRRNATVKTFVGAPGRFSRHAVRRNECRRGRRHPVHRLHPFRLDQQAGMGLRHLSRRRHHHPGRADVLVGQGRALSFRRARARAGRHPPLRRLARPPDRPRVVLENLLHGVIQPGDGNPRSAAEVQRLHLLHGYPHLRPLRGSLLLGEPGEA